jgi:hypothetical protein
MLAKKEFTVATRDVLPKIAGARYRAERLNVIVFFC